MRFVVLITLLSGLVTSAFASISVSPDIFNFLPGKSVRQQVMVINNGDKDAYVNATSFVVEHPGTKQEKKVEFHDPGKAGMLVTPNKMIIPPHQFRLVRLVVTKPPSKTDRIYRIDIAPVAPELLAKQKTEHGDAMGIKVIIAYGVLAIVRPENMHSDLIIKREGHKLIASNKGNSNIIITGGQQCLKDKCVKIPPHRMYSGNTWTVPLKYTTPVTIHTNQLNKNKTLKIV